MRSNRAFEMMDGGHVRGVVTVQDAGEYDIWAGAEQAICEAAAVLWRRETAYCDSTRMWEVTIRLAGEEEAREMNRDFRHKDYATNVLSFPNEDGAEEGDEEWYVGDIMICVPVVQKEAKEQGKDALQHLQHMVVHGMLHLVGYDHELGEAEADVMEALEIEVLAELGIANPYEEEKVN